MRKKSVGNSNDNSTASRQTIYQRATQRDGSPNYVFLYSDDDCDADQEDIPLEPRSRAKQPLRKVEVIKVLLKAEDTLQALALRYRCTISELKRINNIHKENEIFAHRHIQVPVQPYSILTENLIDLQTTGVENGSPEWQESAASSSQTGQAINTAAMHNSPATLSQNVGINDIILNSVCEPLAKPLNSESALTFKDTETDVLLAPEDRLPIVETSAIDSFKCSGADWGLSWAHLLGVSLLLGFAGPLIYIFYIAEESPEQGSHFTSRHGHGLRGPF